MVHNDGDRLRKVSTFNSRNTFKTLLNAGRAVHAKVEDVPGTEGKCKTSLGNSVRPLSKPEGKERWGGGLT